MDVRCEHVCFWKPAPEAPAEALQAVFEAARTGLSTCQQCRLLDALFMQHTAARLHQSFSDPSCNDAILLQSDVALEEMLEDRLLLQPQQARYHVFEGQLAQKWRPLLADALDASRVRL